MTIQAIGTTALALYLTPGDLHARGLRPQELDLSQAVTLTREACASAGLSLPEPLEIEAYPDEAGVLVFAHLQLRPPAVFSFDGLPDLLAALSLLSEPPAAAHLTYWEGRYYLTLAPGGETPPPVLSEFGLRERDDRLPVRLAEHGESLLRTGELLRLYRSVRR